MAKKTTTAAKIREFFAANPDATVIAASNKLGIPAKYIHQIRYMDKRNGRTVVPIESVADRVRAKLERIKVDLVNHPPHYKVGGIETIDFIEAKKLSYNLGNVVKYITRAKHKGDFVQDLEKAQWYLGREIYLARFPNYGKDQAVADDKRQA